MKSKKFFDIFTKAIMGLYKNPAVFIAATVFFIFVFSISLLGKKIAPFLQSSVSNILWVTIFFIIFLAGAAFLFGAVSDFMKPKKESRGFFNSGRKFWLRNFLLLAILWVLMVMGNGILFLFTKFMTVANPIFAISEATFKIIAFLIYFFWLILFVIFFSFSNCYCVLYDLRLKESIGKSFSLVKKEYLATLSLLVIIFVLTFFLNMIPGSLGEVLVYLISIPLTVFTLTKFVIFSEENR